MWVEIRGALMVPLLRESPPPATHYQWSKTMKIAAVTDDGVLISPHFGRATQYLVLTVEDGQIVTRETRPKPGHREFAREHVHDGPEHHAHEHHGHSSQGHGFGQHAEGKHRRMFAPVLDCQVVLARGMGRGAYLGLQQAGLRPVITDIPEIEKAALAAAAGTIVDHRDRLH
jgi:predicted Fe-Mo cluster-binding NifX family protein